MLGWVAHLMQYMTAAVGCCAVGKGAQDASGKESTIVTGSLASIGSQRGCAPFMWQGCDAHLCLHSRRGGRGEVLVCGVCVTVKHKPTELQHNQLYHSSVAHSTTLFCAGIGDQLFLTWLE